MSDKKHGTGVYTWADGSKYEGDFKGDLAEGHGKKIFVDKSYYEGAWIRGRQHGYGTYFHPSGARWVGEWRRGKRTHDGMLQCHSMQILHDNSCLPACPDGTYELVTKQRCATCHSRCVTCTKAGKFGCTSCSAEKSIVEGECVEHVEF
jgi:hypothetical protein